MAFFWLLSARHRATVTSQLQQRLREDTQTLEAVLFANEDTSNIDVDPRTRELLNAIARDKVSRLALEDSRREVLWHSRDAVAMFTGDTPEIAAALEQREAFDTRRLAASRETWLFYARAVGPSEAPTAVLRAAFPVTQLYRELSAADVRIWMGVITTAVLALAITYVVVGRIIEPLETLTQAAQRIAAGDIPAEVPVGSRNEIGTLAAAFNAMGRELTARIQDLHDQRRQIEDHHHRLEAVLSAMIEGVMAIDAEQRILLANKAAVRLLDMRPTSTVGRKLWESVRLHPLQQLVEHALAGGERMRSEVEVSRTQCTIAVTVSLFPGNPSPGAVLVMHDVTELRRLENLRREFVQNVSHELKTPLSSISAYADTLLEGGLDDPDSNRRFVQRISEQADRLHVLILDLLALGRLESDEQTFDVLPTDVSRIVQASIDAHQGVASAKRLSLSGQGAASVWGLADDEGLRTIVDNLLDNAVNYTPEGGRVCVRWRNDAEHVVIDVEDSGAGIAKEHQTRIFERFFRIDKARSRELGGTGLGLAIVKHLCQVFGGSVKVNSQLGRGSTFTVQLRLAEELIEA